MCDSTDRKRAHHSVSPANVSPARSEECLCDCAVVASLANHSVQGEIKKETGPARILPFPGTRLAGLG
jgi:hypothetical protein